jgi:cell division protease FtsH
MQKVDAEIRSIIDEQYRVARDLIESNQDKMHAMAKALLEWETIDSEQIDDIMSGRPPRAPRPPSSGSDTPHVPPSAGQAAANPDKGPAATPV